MMNPNTEANKSSQASHNPQAPLPFADNLAYLNQRLLLLHMRLAYCQQRNKTPHQQYLGFRTLGSSTTPASSFQVENITLEQLYENQAEIQQRVEASMQEGLVFPLETLRENFQLNPFEEQVLLFALAVALDKHFLSNASLSRKTTDSSNIPTISQVTDSLTSTLPERVLALGCFAPEAPLRHHQLILCQAPAAQHSQACPLEDQVFFLAPEMLFTLLNNRPHPRRELSISLPQEGFPSLDLSTQLREDLQEILARFLAEKGASPSFELNESDEEELFVFAADEGDGTQWRKIFAHGLVFALPGEDFAPSPNSSNPSQKSRRKLIQRISRAARRPVLWQSVWSDAADYDPLSQLQQTLRDARIQKAAVALTDVEDGLADLNATQQQLWLQEIGNFHDLLFLDASLPSHDTLKQQVVLTLSLPNDPKSTLAQHHGPPILQHVQNRGLAQLQKQIAVRVLGQRNALQRMTEILFITKAKLDPAQQRPDGIFLLVGPEGTGKEETALLLNDALHGNQAPLIRVSMSTYQTPDAIDIFVGNVTTEAGKNLSLPHVAKSTPNAVILLDDLEQAHPQILAPLLQIFTEGSLTNKHGHTVSFAQNTFLLTVNVNADLFEPKPRLGFKLNNQQNNPINEIQRTLCSMFPPQFLGAVDEVLVFSPLGFEQMLLVSQQKLQQVQKHFARRGVWLEFDPNICRWLLEHTSREEGIRGLQNAIDQRIIPVIAELLLKRPNLTQAILTLRGEEVVAIAS